MTGKSARRSIVDLVEHQVIAAVRTDEQYEVSLEAKPNMLFLLGGSILDIAGKVDRAKRAGKTVFLHMDFMEGIAADRAGVSYVAREVQPDGVISTRSQVIGLSREAGLHAVQRLFLIDSTALRSGLKAIHSSGADAVEVMPGIMPAIISELADLTPLPIIAGGLVRTRSEVLAALEAGALAVSVGAADLWNADLDAR